MDSERADWYVRQRDYYLYVDPKPEDNLTLFQQDASFIVHTNTFYPGYYAVETINFANHYIQLRDDGYLWIENEQYTSAYIDAASFKLYEYNTSRKYCRFGPGNGSPMATNVVLVLVVVLGVVVVVVVIRFSKYYKTFSFHNRL